ncbi:MAG: hypothetical protein AUH85_17675 [Chloroflexi bacterium 13_1_40CM_4_68_4]|nr:MAG: hypothetical protein AUH85_17675 [Chloroflexi bacterium 13_1_40CM_4_68_4]
MRRAAILLALVLASCVSAGSDIAKVPGTAPASASPGAAAVWPLRGTPAPNADAAKTRPIVVKVGNDGAARPQTGIAQADLIIEVPVEGGLTRLAVVFQSNDPARVGPVRSARQSDLNYLSPLHAILAHVGASEAVTKAVRDAAKSGGFIDVDEFQHAEAFERTTDRQPPYNAYTSGAKLRQAAGSAAGEKVAVGAFAFGNSDGGADGATLTIPYGEPVKYEFASGTYHRTAGGTKTVDTAGGEVMPDNVVVIKTDVTEIPGTADAAGAPSFDYRATGSGAVVIMRDGKRFEGTWSRDANDQYAFKDASGKPILLKPGLTWMHIVPKDFAL